MVSGEKPWERSRARIPGLSNDPRPNSQTKQEPTQKSRELGPGIPGMQGFPRPIASPAQPVAGAKKRSSRNGMLAILGIFAVTGLALLANSSFREDRATSSLETVPSEVANTGTTPKGLPDGALTQWESLAKSVVYIEATGASCNWSGSGSIVLDGSYVLTNQHVAGDGECSLRVGFTNSTNAEPSDFVRAEVLVSNAALDLAVIRLLDQSGAPFISPMHKPLEIDYASLKLGDKIYTLGYPGVGGSTVTLTSGDYSGMDHSDSDYYKTTANMNPGVSGGSALSVGGKLIGVPTAGVVDPETKQRVGLNLIRPISFAREMLDRAKTLRVPDASVESVESNDSSGNEESSADPLFGTCAEAKRNGYGPYYRGSDYEYDNYDDRDNDGIVCE